MATIGVVLLAFAFVCFVLAAFGAATKYNLVAAGLAFWVAAVLFSGITQLLR